MAISLGCLAHECSWRACGLREDELRTMLVALICVCVLMRIILPNLNAVSEYFTRVSQSIPTWYDLIYGDSIKENEF
jgi:hypothetical protein